MDLIRSEEWWWRVVSTTAGSWRSRRTNLWSSEGCYNGGGKWTSSDQKCGGGEWRALWLESGKHYGWRVESTMAGSWRSRRAKLVEFRRMSYMAAESSPHMCSRVVLEGESTIACSWRSRGPNLEFNRCHNQRWKMALPCK